MFIKKLIIALTVIGSLGACNKVVELSPESDLDANEKI